MNKNIFKSFLEIMDSNRVIVGSWLIAFAYIFIFEQEGIFLERFWGSVPSILLTGITWFVIYGIISISFFVFIYNSFNGKEKLVISKGSRMSISLLMGVFLWIITGSEFILKTEPEGSIVLKKAQERAQWPPLPKSTTKSKIKKKVNNKSIDGSTLVWKDSLMYIPDSDKPFSGEAVRYYGNGQKGQEIPYKDGKRDGLHTEWYENGQKSSKRIYKDGEIDGLEMYWYENGQKFIEGTYKNGELISSKCWDEDGDECECNMWGTGCN